jgi:uncharacterized membrane protein
MTITGYGIYEVILLFFIYAFLGWCAEVCFAALTTGKFTNRGFLNGPICPIYGVGALIVILALTPVSDRLVILFFSSMVLTTLLEYVTGLVLEKIFHAKWWDYSDRPFNIRGYICLEFSVLWGLACTGIMKLVHPTIYALVRHLPHVLGVVLNSLFLVLLIVDLVATVMAIHHLNQRLALITRTAQRIHSMSDKLGENLYEGTVAAKAKSEEAKEALEDTRETLSQQKLSLEGKVAGLQTKALESAEEKAIARAERLTQKREAAQLRTEAAAEELSQRQEGKRSREELELRSKLKAALSEKHFLQDRILRDFPALKHRNQGAFAQLRKFRSSNQETLPEAEEILAQEGGKEASPRPKSFPHMAGAFLLGLAVGVIIMVVLERYSTMLI